MKKEYIKADLEIVKQFDGDVLLFSGELAENGAVVGKSTSLQ